MPHADRHATPWLSYLCLAASMALVGSYVGLSKSLVTVFPIFLLAGLRFAIAAVAMAGWVRKPADEPPLGPRQWRLLFLESLLGNFLFSICMLYGVAMSTALAAGVIMAALPAAVALLSRVVLRERLDARVLAGIVCAVGGIAVVAFMKAGPASSASAAGDPTWGHLLLIGAVFCEASYVIIGKQLTGHVGARRISAIVNLWGLLLVSPLALWQALSFDFGSVGAATWGLLGFYSLAASTITVWLWMTGLKRVSAARAGVFTVMLPLAAAAVGVGLLGERISSPQVAAYALALTGLLLATWPARR
ncbi:DMT family transporter [Leptothrix discophora]|uniref:DMT family transporter n=1 Tax=Leptothrix discophora TaxID=89 RepID=A0ABT9G2J8_LEPDI|nr:DMT family transporter [Leptothrix discophora]MDP4300712.1 DMT family transporter [Leptothrix discophora]